jgi:TetR/AcrR family transcriptional regulator
MVSRPRSPKPRVRDPIRTKQSLLTAGIRLFASRGYHGVAVDEIVAAAGCNKRMLYHYFGDKEGLYAAVLQAVYARLEKVEMQPIAQDAATADVVREIMARYFDFLSHDPEFVNLLLWENLNQGRILARHPDLLTKAPVLVLLRDVLEAAKRRGEIGDIGDVRHLLILMIGMCFIYFSNRHTLRQSVGLDLDRPSVRAEGLRTAQRMFLAYLGLDERSKRGEKRGARR